MTLLLSLLLTALHATETPCPQLLAIRAKFETQIVEDSAPPLARDEIRALLEDRQFARALEAYKRARAVPQDLGDLPIEFRGATRIYASGAGVRFPPPFRQTILPYVTAVHEIDHRIRIAKLFAQLQESDAALVFTMKKRIFGDRVYNWLEDEAIKAEWDLLALASPQILFEAELTLRQSRVETFHKDLYTKTLYHALDLITHEQGRDEYLRRMHGIGRYDHGAP